MGVERRGGAKAEAEEPRPWRMMMEWRWVERGGVMMGGG